MKKKLRIPILLILCITLGGSHSQAQFTAEITDVKQGVKKNYLVQSDGEKYRYDIVEDDANIVVIADPSSNRTAVLFPEKKMFQYTDLMSSVSEDPFQAYKYWKKKLIEKEVSTEKVWGFETVITELYDGDQKVFTVWYSKELQFILKMTNHLVDNFYMEMTHIEQRRPDADLFIVPDDYVEVDKRMRPVIPEPPPPESWKVIPSTLPINAEFVRGDRIIFKVPDGERYRIDMKNEISEQGKIIRTCLRDGVVLPEDKIGPVSFRTTRLNEDETFSVLYIGKPGDEVILDIYHGKLKVEVRAEKR